MVEMEEQDEPKSAT